MALAGASSPAFWSLNQRGFYCDAVATMQHQFCESVSHWNSVGWRMVDFPTYSMYPKPSICLGLQKFLWFSAITVGTNHPHCFYTLQRWPAFLGFVAFIHTSSVLLDFDNRSPSWSVSDHLTRSAFWELSKILGSFSILFLLEYGHSPLHPNLNLRKFLDRNQPFQPVCDSPSNPRHHSCKLGSAAHASARWPSALENAKSWQHQPPGFFSVKHVLHLHSSTFNPNNLFYKDSQNFLYFKEVVVSKASFVHLFQVSKA